MGTQMDYLAHHGILGMKWGVRRYQNKDGSLTKEGMKRYAREERLTEKREDVKYRSTLTDQELRDKINRLQLERQLRQLTDEEINRGRSAINEILSKVGKDTATDILKAVFKGIGLYGINRIVSGKPVNRSELASAIFKVTVENADDGNKKGKKDKQKDEDNDD